MSCHANVDDWLLDDQTVEFLRELAEPANSLPRADSCIQQRQDTPDLFSLKEIDRAPPQALQDNLSDETQVSAHLPSTSVLEHTRKLNRQSQKRFREKRKVTRAI